LRGEAPLDAVAGQPDFVPDQIDDDFAEVHAQQHLKRAVEFADPAAGSIRILTYISEAAIVL
jgi:hypothetical protein